MDTLFQGIEGILVYLDNILVTGSTQEKYLHNLHTGLLKIQGSRLKLKKSKCTFMAPKAQYLGHVIDKKWLTPLFRQSKSYEGVKTSS